MRIESIAAKNGHLRVTMTYPRDCLPRCFLNSLVGVHADNRFKGVSDIVDIATSAAKCDDTTVLVMDVGLAISVDTESWGR